MGSRLRGEVGHGEPSQNVIRDVLLLLIHEPVTGAFVVDHLGLREELLHQTNANLGAGYICSSTEEEDRNIDRVGWREVTGWNVRMNKLVLTHRTEVYSPFSSSKRILVVR